jgi:hypothetical protein
MKVYSCVKFYASRLKDEPEPRWPVDYDFQEEMSQRGDGIDALEDAFYRCVGDFKPGRRHRAGRRYALAQRRRGMEVTAADTLADTHEAAAEKNHLTESLSS